MPNDRWSSSSLPIKRETLFFPLPLSTSYRTGPRMTAHPLGPIPFARTSNMQNAKSRGLIAKLGKMCQNPPEWAQTNEKIWFGTYWARKCIKGVLSMYSICSFYILCYYFDVLSYFRYGTVWFFGIAHVLRHVMVLMRSTVR